MGCDEESTTNLQHYFENYIKSKLSTYNNICVRTIFCNSLTSTLYGIAKQVCYGPLNENDDFIENIYDEIYNSLDSKTCDEILLVGHSYGGMVASVVAKKANKDSSLDKSKLKIVTLGSIYIPLVHEVDKINIFHIINKCDVAYKCNGISTPTNNDEKFYDKDHNIYWIQSKVCELPKSKSWGIGSRNEWNIHNDYIDVYYIDKDTIGAYIKHFIMDYFAMDLPLNTYLIPIKNDEKNIPPPSSTKITTPVVTPLSTTSVRLTSDNIKMITYDDTFNELYMKDVIVPKLKAAPFPMNYELDANNYTKIYVTSDIHADFSRFISMLQLAKLIDTPIDPYILDNTGIYDPNLIANATWIGGSNAVLVIVGDLVDGRRPTMGVNIDVDDPKGSFEFLLHAFLYNLRLSALEQGSDVRFTIGNHDYHTIILNDSALNSYIHTTARTYFGDIDSRAAALRPFYERMPFYYLSIMNKRKSQVEFVHGGLRPNWYTSSTGSGPGYNSPDKDYTADLIKFQKNIASGTKKIDNFKDIQKVALVKSNGDVDGPLWGRAYARSTNCPLKSDGHTLIIVGHCPTNRDDARYTELNKKSAYIGCGHTKHCVYTDCGGSLAFVDVASSASMMTDRKKPVEMLYLEHIDTLDEYDFKDGRYYNRMKRIVLDPATPNNVGPLKINFQKDPAVQHGGTRHFKHQTRRQRG